MKIINASAHDLRQIEDRSVHAIITSPPYLWLRAYRGEEQSVEWPEVRYRPMNSLPEITIPGCNPKCDHEWITSGSVGAHDGQVCIRCNGWRGPLGLEPSVEAYVAHLVLCMREWRRVLRDDGLLFVNMGDTYAANRPVQVPDNLRGSKHDTGFDIAYAVPDGLQPKDQINVPERLRLAAQADGWILRKVIPWIKSASRPESVKDRPVTSHEDWMMFAKTGLNYWDYWGSRIMEKFNPSNMAEGHALRTSDIFTISLREVMRSGDGMLASEDDEPLAILANPTGFKGSHYAVFPPNVIAPLILGATSPRVCDTCGAPYKRNVAERRTDYTSQDHPVTTGGALSGGVGKNFPTTSARMLGWVPTCEHDGGYTKAIILDPFAGTGTTGAVAHILGRDSILVDASAYYIEEHMPARIQEITGQIMVDFTLRNGIAEPEFQQMMMELDL